VGKIDFTDNVKNLRGQDFIDQVRTIALLSAGSYGVMTCGACRKEPAKWIGMQACGAPGGPFCHTCVDHQRDWMNTAEAIAEAQPYCRHCDEDVDRSHIYVVDLYSRINDRITL
jgi:hypothetical protein